MPFSSSSLRNGDASVDSVAVCLGHSLSSGFAIFVPLAVK